jgi:general transcription factor 3C polypeptide 3 (transcription factor C subunit 4)
LISQNQFNNEMYRLLMASLSSGLRPTDSFITSTLQKFLFREMKLIDLATKNPEALKWNPVNKRYAPTGKKAGEAQDEPDDDSDGLAADVAPSAESGSNSDRPILPTKKNPLVVAMYGQMCVAAKSYQSAICEIPSFPLLSIPCTLSPLLQFTYSMLMITAQKTP